MSELVPRTFLFNSEVVYLTFKLRILTVISIITTNVIQRDITENLTKKLKLMTKSEFLSKKKIKE